MGERGGSTLLTNGYGGGTHLDVSPRARLLGTTSPKAAKRPPVQPRAPLGGAGPASGNAAAAATPTLYDTPHRHGVSEILTGLPDGASRSSLLSEPLLNGPPASSFTFPAPDAATEACSHSPVRRGRQSPPHLLLGEAPSQVPQYGVLGGVGHTQQQHYQQRPPGSPPLAPLHALLKVVTPVGEGRALGTGDLLPRRSPRSPRDPELATCSPRATVRSQGSAKLSSVGSGASPRVLLEDDGVLSSAVKAAVEREARDAPASEAGSEEAEDEEESRGTVEDFSRTLLEELRVDGKDVESKDFNSSRTIGMLKKASMDMSASGPPSTSPVHSGGAPVVLPVSVSGSGGGGHHADTSHSVHSHAGSISGVFGAAAGSEVPTPRPTSDGLGETHSNTARSLDRPQSPRMRDSAKDRELHAPQHHHSQQHLFWESISPSRMADTLNRKFGCCRCWHDRKTTGDNYAEVTQKTGAAGVSKEAARPLPMDDENLALIARVRNIMHSELTPYMKKEELEEMALQLQAAIFNLSPMPFTHRIEIVIKAVPTRWAGHVEEAIQTLKVRYGSNEPKLKPSTQHGARIIELFWQGDTSQTGYLTQAQTKTLLRVLGMRIAKHIFENRFKQFDANMNGVLEFSDFQGFYDKMCERAELAPIFTEIGGKGSTSESLDLYDFHEFLEKWQGEPGHTIARTRELIAEWGCLEYQGFCRYVTSPDNTWWNANRSRVYQDMTHPLSSYYVFSSHNTYLSGDQITSESSVLMYKYALLRGCRCVEIDVWDGKEGHPIVTHGRTKTSSIYFKDVIEVINENAFIKSKYPLVLSLEVHASLPQQVLMADTMRRVFGSKLTDPLTDPLAYTPAQYTPEALKEKILLKGRDTHLLQSSLDPEAEMSRTLSVVTGQSQSTHSHSIQSAQNSPSNGDYPSFAESFSTNVVSTPSKSQQQGHGRRVAPELAACLYLKSIKLINGSDVQATLQTVRPQNILSLPEWKAERMMGHDLAMMTRKLLTRVYPKGTRVDSSNFDPQLLWSSGAHYVALNLQTPDYPVRLNQAKFEDNGRAGWLLKPEWLRSNTQTSHETRELFILDVLVLSGGNLPHSRKSIDPFVEGFISGAPCDDTSRTPQRTSAVENNGFNPVFSECFSFRIRVKELAILTLRVMNRCTGAFIAEASIPVTCLRTGTRSVPLCDSLSRTIEGSFLLGKFSTRLAPISEEVTPPAPLNSARKRFGARRRSKTATAQERQFSRLFPAPMSPVNPASPL